jgi:hypothetical protein
MAKSLIKSFTTQAMRELIQTAGFRAELMAESDTMPVIRSASNGMIFEIRLFNPLKEEKGSFTDVMFMAGMPLQGGVAPEFLNRWNSIKRFGRLYAAQGHLVLALDIFLQGGVSPEHLRSQLDIWDKLLQELLTYIRAVPSAPAPKAVTVNGHTEPVNSEIEPGVPENASPSEKIPERESEMASPQ